MRRCVTLMLVLMPALAPSAAEALEWQSTATTVIKTFPKPEPQPPWVKANGFHQVALTQISVGDTVFPIRFRINPGQLFESGVVQAACFTPWVWAHDALSVMCLTLQVDNPCENGWWQASTLGQLEGHPGGGYKQAFSPIFVVDCECV